jgi:hypothetical protein
MKPTAQDKGFSFKKVIGIFWEWRQASISVEVCFFGKAESSDTVRVSIDGLVSLVDPEGIITVSGDGREIELDLRGCEFRHAREVPERQDIFDPLDPDSILQVKFPNGEVCLIFPYRRVAPSTLAHKRAASGLDWLRGKLGHPVTGAWMKKADSHTGKAGARIFSLSGGYDRSSKPGTSRTGPPLFPVAAFLVIFLMAAFALTPGSFSKLLSEIGVSQRSMSDPNAMVWAIQQEGNYYCSGSVLAGRKPGQFMKQADALTRGYQPALGHYCGSGMENTAPDGNISAFFIQLGQSGGRLFSRLLSLSRSLLSGADPRSASARPLPAAPAPRSAQASSPKSPGMSGFSTPSPVAESAGNVAASSSSATVPVPGTPRPE